VNFASSSTTASQIISTLFSNENIIGSVLLGGYLILASQTANELHWTDVDELYEGTNTWSQTNTGFVAGKNASAVSGSDVRHIWVAGQGGYIYFVNNFKVAAAVQDAGIATTQNLNAIHAKDSQNVIAVGNSNAVVFTTNGGSIWEAATGPAVGVNLGACWMWDSAVWIVGEGAGGTGKLWLTTNSGSSWSQIGLPASYLRIDKIKFVSDAEGYILARSGGQAYVLRTITAGYEWYVLPQGKKGTPIANSYLNDLAVTDKFSNTVYAVGITGAGAGIALKMSGG